MRAEIDGMGLPPSLSVKQRRKLVRLDSLRDPVLQDADAFDLAADRLAQPRPFTVDECIARRATGRNDVTSDQVDTA